MTPDNDTGPLADSVRSAVRRREGVDVLARRDAEAAAERRRERFAKVSCYDPSVVRAYMHMVQFLIAEGRAEMTGFVMVEPAGSAGWHAFTDAY